MKINHVVHIVGTTLEENKHKNNVIVDQFYHNVITLRIYNHIKKNNI
jgi:hypothetical protein